MDALVDAAYQQDEAKARDVLATAALPPEVERINLEVRRDWSGEPALYLSFVVGPSTSLDRATTQRLSQFMGSIAEKLLRSGITLFPYTSLDEAA